MSADIRADDLTVRRGETVALDALTLSVPAGSVTAMLGPNGAGKTTFARTVATLQPYGGSLVIDGLEVSSAPDAVRRVVSVTGQDTSLPDQHSAAEYLRVVARLRGRSRRDARRVADTTIADLDLGSFATRRLGRCSGGQRRRVALAASLVGEPRIIVLDEPTTGLDPHSRVGIWEQVDRLRAHGVSVLLTTQDLSEAARLAQRVIILDRGRCVTAGSLRELRATQHIRRLSVALDGDQHEQQVRSLSDDLAADARIEATGLTFVGGFDAATVHRALASSGLLPHTTEFHLEPPSLEEIYRAVLDARQEQPT